MKMLRMACVLGVFLALAGGAAWAEGPAPVSAANPALEGLFGPAPVPMTFPVECSFTCSGTPHYAGCNGTLAQCCSRTRISCPDPDVFETGTCYSTTSSAYLVC